MKATVQSKRQALEVRAHLWELPTPSCPSPQKHVEAIILNHGLISLLSFLCCVVLFMFSWNDMRLICLVIFNFTKESLKPALSPRGVTFRWQCSDSSTLLCLPVVAGVAALCFSALHPPQLVDLLFQQLTFRSWTVCCAISCSTYVRACLDYFRG